MSQKLGEGSIELAPESVTGVVGPSRAGQPQRLLRESEELGRRPRNWPPR